MSRGISAVVAACAAVVIGLAGQAVAAVPSGGGVRGSVADTAALGGHQVPTPEEATSLTEARHTGRPVEVVADRTETSQVTALPDGNFGYTSSVAPVRVRRAGGWVDVDRTLRRRADGTVAPAAGPSDIVFSGGGTGPLVTLTAGGTRLRLGWPGAVSRPTLAGDTATYAGVLPGVDLRLRATPTGFSHVLVVRSAAAARNPALASVRLTLSVTGGTLGGRPGGGLEVRDAAGAVVFAAAAPAMWDSGAGGGPDDRGRTAPVGMALVPGGMVLTPDRSLLVGPGTRYPVTIDPSWDTWDARKVHWLTVYKEFDSGWYDSDDSAKTGYQNYDSPVTTVRSFFELDTPRVNGAHIGSATFSIQQVHAPSCSASRGTELHMASAFHNDDNWSSHSGMGYLIGTASTGCPSGPTAWSVTGAVQQAADAGWPNLTLGMKAASETDPLNWRRWDPGTAQIYIEFNFVPTSPRVATDTTNACVVGSGQPVFGAGTTPTLHATVGDADHTVVSATFTVNPAPSPIMGGPDPFWSAGDWDRDGHPDLIAREQSHQDLYLYPGNGTNWDARVLLLSGWGGYTAAGVADWDGDGYPDLIARDDATGNLWLYPGDGRRDALSARFLIGTGWSGWTFFGVADYDHDGHPDIVARYDANGLLMLYPGEGTRAVSTQPAVQIGSGWTGYTPFGVLDWDGDGNADIVARADQAGLLWLYPGEGKRAPSTRAPVRIGDGWWNFRAVTTPDFTGDGKPDVVARDPDVGTLWLYPGNGAAYGAERRPVGPPFRVTLAAQQESTPFNWPVPIGLLEDGGAYGWTAQGTDGLDAGPVSPACGFAIDMSAPRTAPGVTSATFPVNGSGGRAGVPGMVSFDGSGDPDVAGFRYSVEPGGPADVYVPATTPGGRGTSLVLPVSDGPFTLTVRPVDASGNRGLETDYPFTVARTSPKPVVYDGAALASLTAPTGHAVVQPDCCGAKWADGRQWFWPDAAVGDHVDLTLTVPADGWYDLAADLTLAPDYGVVRYALDGHPLRQPRDQFAGAVATDLADLGAANLTAGPHTLTATVIDRNPHATGTKVGMDYLTLTPVTPPTDVEGESLTVVSATAPYSAASCCGVHWSGDQALVFSPTKVGDQLTVAFTAPADGVYDLSGAFTFAGDYGVVQPALDGHPLGRPYNFYWSSFPGVVRRSLGVVPLATGTHQLTFTLVGPLNSAGNRFAIDYLTLAPVAAAAAATQFEGEDLLAGGTGSAGVSAQVVSCDCMEFWSGTKELAVHANRPGDSFTVAVDVSAAGRYTLTAGLNRQTSLGVVAVSVDGTRVGPAFDAYNGWGLTADVSFGATPTLSAGPHTITFTAVDRDTASSGYDFGVDYLRLIPLPAL